LPSIVAEEAAVA